MTTEKNPSNEGTPVPPEATKKEKKTPKAKKASTKIVVSQDDIKTIRITVESLDDSPCLPHRFPKKAKNEMLAKMMGLRGPRSSKTAKRRPVQDALEAMYFIPDDGERVAKIPTYDPDLDELDVDAYLEALPLDFLRGHRLGIPAPCFKKALTRASKSAGFVMTDIKCAVRVKAHGPHGLIEIESPNVPIMRCDYVRLKSGMSSTTDLRFRCEVLPWRATMDIEYDSLVITHEQLIAIVAKSGRTVGVCDWRLEKDGPFGGFRVVEAGLWERREAA